ncbi:hypothetical protein Ccrd_013785 [Cynara cardunculus var. scolymus]|uniref:Uncharacterized protein n=1 Tax=Cynara cardunculus var. scolymus TaxID=59895 RepID=A0A103YEY4_CYNCS|nr:hypothetical protein Ccrd_013785 [Cynara cardunculus var. scolymus]
MDGAQEIVETPTQFFSNPETIKGVDKIIKVYEKLQMPDFSLGLTQEFEEVVDPKENAPNRDDNDVVPNVKPISEIDIHRSHWSKSFKGGRKNMFTVYE